MALVLSIDDSLFQRNMIRNSVQEWGHTTLEATNGREGLEMAKAHQPDCIVLDLLMPEMDGMQVLEQLQSQGIKAPAIVMTADIQEGVNQRCLEPGAFHLLTNPNR
ncbi:response regulator [bacterium]|nr:response regulator [bacterium]